jgi:4'-phosphopantetheinyl transferase
MANLHSQAVSQWDQLLTNAHVWHLTPEALIPDVLQSMCLDWLAPAERARRERFRTGPLRHTYLATRVLCRWVLSRYTGVGPRDWQFIENAQGKPAIAAPAEFASLRFNLTHTQGLVACVVTRAGEAGLDAEETSRPIDVAAVAGQFFSVTERSCLSGLPAHRRHDRFYEYWVVKEAYLKALGTGLSRPLDDFTIDWRDDGQPCSLDGCQLALHYPAAGYVAATAVQLPRDAPPLPITWQAAQILV